MKRYGQELYLKWGERATYPFLLAVISSCFISSSLNTFSFHFTGRCQECGYHFVQSGQLVHHTIGSDFMIRSGGVLNSTKNQKVGDR
jgi:hypothetical protein